MIPAEFGIHDELEALRRGEGRESLGGLLLHLHDVGPRHRALDLRLVEADDVEGRVERRVEVAQRVHLNGVVYIRLGCLVCVSAFRVSGT